MGLDEGAGGAQSIAFILVRGTPLRKGHAETVVGAAERLK
jgi:hypothetical protein